MGAIRGSTAHTSKSPAPKGPRSWRRTTDEEASAWADRHERGETVGKIARSVGRSPHTVKTWIEQVRAGEERSVVRLEAMKEAFSAHQNDLLALLDLIGKQFEDVTVPVIGLRGRARGTGKPFGPFNIPKIEAEETEVVLDVENGRDWGFLAEHLGRDAALRAIGQAKKMAATLASRELDLRKTVEDKLAQATGFEISEGDPTSPSVTRAGIAAILDAACQGAAGAGSRSRSVVTKVRVQDKALMYGSNTFLVLGHNDPASLFAPIVGVLKDVLSSDEYDRLRTAVNDYAAAAERSADEIGVLLSAHFVPGECRACRRLGM